MTSAVPYDPDDFENNNPFAEPSIPVSQESTEQTANYNEETSAEPISSVITTQQEQTPSEAITETTNESTQIITESELRKLIPERFTCKYKITIELRDIEKNKPGNPILKFDATVQGLPKFRQASYKDIRRTYNEVLKFNKYLSVSNIEVFVPVLPSSVTSYPSGGVDENKQLMNEWQEWFNRITANSILTRDEEFLYFIESDFGYSVINSSNKTSIASGLLRKTLKQLQVPYDPYEELSEFRPIIKASYLTFQKLHKVLDKKSKSEKQLSVHFGDLSQKLIQLSEFEMIHPGMKNMWEKLSKISSIQSDLQLIESVNDMGSFGDGIQNMSNDFYQIKEALTNRHLIMRELSSAEKDTKAKHLHANKVKNKSSLDPLKVDEAIRSLEYATKIEESLNLQLKRISGEMLYEKEELIDHTEKKIKSMLQNFTLNKVEHHRKILKYLENIRLDIRIIDAKGGLSRLNRENLSNLKHNLTQSQSPNGDSWTQRTFRSLNSKAQEVEINENKKDDNDQIDVKHAASLLGVATF